mgnify:CR=1
MVIDGLHNEKGDNTNALCGQIVGSTVGGMLRVRLIENKST